MDIDKFCDKVDQILDYQWGLEDGGDLCYNLVEQGVIDMSIGVDSAALIVVQHMQQA